MVVQLSAAVTNCVRIVLEKYLKIPERCWVHVPHMYDPRNTVFSKTVVHSVRLP